MAFKAPSTIAARAAILLGVALALAAVAPHASRAGAFDVGARAFERQDYVRSATVMTQLAVRGDARAQSYLGYMYASGLGVPQNYEQAAQWMRRAAEQGLPSAQYFLGLMYDKGLGVPQDFVIAQAWLNLAVAHAVRRDRDPWTRIRNAVAGKMTMAQLEEAQQLALDFRPGRAMR